MDHEIAMSRKMATHSATKWILSRILKKALCIYDTLSGDNGFSRFLYYHCHLNVFFTNYGYAPELFSHHLFFKRIDGDSSEIMDTRP